MSKITQEKLAQEIAVILENADLSKTSAKKVRQSLEVKLKCDLTQRKKLVDELVMEFVNSKNASDSPSESEEESIEEEPVKRKPSKKSAKRSDSDRNSDSEEDYKPKKKKKRDDSDSDDWKKEKKPKKKPKSKSEKTGPKKATGFTRPYPLSPELTELMGGKNFLPRHEVVKHVWSLIKERNLYDQNNKQFAICDDELFKVMGIRRFRTFGMMKYLMPHFLKE